jgi:hypothetical protein
MPPLERLRIFMCCAMIRLTQNTWVERGLINSSMAWPPNADDHNVLPTAALVKFDSLALFECEDGKSMVPTLPV